MKNYKIIEVMGDFDTLVNSTIQANTLEHAKQLVMKEVQDNINKYMYACVEEVENE